MLRALITIESMCYVCPDDPLTDTEHPMHKFIGDVYTIAHIGGQQCRGCGTGSEGQIKTLENMIRILKDANICDVEKHVKDG